MFIYENHIFMLRKYIVIPGFIFLLLYGCNSKSGERKLSNDTAEQKNNISEVKNDLSETEEAYSNFDYTSVLKEYSEMLPGDISITKYKYFIIFSDLKPEITYQLINNDIKNTVDAMLSSYITVKPDKVIPIVLFENYNSYRDFAVNNFAMDENDLSPYGFYKISRNAIIIRYVSWKGSLAHELTHSLIQNDFPDIPSWFNEGLAALHEKSTLKNGELVGDFSWRILSIRRAINENTYTGLKPLMKSNDEELYGKRTSFYYAQSRYLLMNLQEKGLLKPFYKEFRKTYKKDNTGITQLEKITGKSLDVLDSELLEYMNSFKQ